MTQPTARVIDERPLATKVEALAGFGLGAADIARVVHMDQAVLEQDYAHELAAGQIKANARVAESLYRKATGEGREAVIAAIFWLKTRARWTECPVAEVVRVPDDPLPLLMQRIAMQGRRIHDRTIVEKDVDHLRPNDAQ
jgi:hypothetical protein